MLTENATTRPSSVPEQRFAEAVWEAREEHAAKGASSACRFAQTITPHIPEMVAACQTILGSEDLAWDAVQETLLRLWTGGWISEDPGGALVHLAIKSSLHQLRCQRRRTYHESKAKELETTCCEEDPLAAFESAELGRRVRAEIRSLTEDYRSVLELFEFDGKSYESIAQHLGLPIGTVRSRISRGRALLRERLLAGFDAA